MKEQEPASFSVYWTYAERGPMAFVHSGAEPPPVFFEEPCHLVGTFSSLAAALERLAEVESYLRPLRAERDEEA